MLLQLLPNVFRLSFDQQPPCPRRGFQGDEGNAKDVHRRCREWEYNDQLLLRRLWFYIVSEVESFGCSRGSNAWLY